jgi:hypothetical protein
MNNLFKRRYERPASVRLRSAFTQPGPEALSAGLVFPRLVLLKAVRTPGRSRAPFRSEKTVKRLPA